MNTALKYMQVNLNPIWCPNHSQNHITHMCCAKTCFLPLCAKCIREHINLHKTQRSHSEVETLEELHEVCTEKVRSAIVNFGNEYAKLEQMSRNLPIRGDEGIKQIRRSKARLIELIEHFFAEFEDRYLNLLSQTAQNHQPLIAEYLARTDKILKKLDKLYAELESKDPLLTMQLIAQQDFDREYTQFNRDLDTALGKISNGPYLITTDEQILESINREIAKFVNIQYSPLETQGNPNLSKGPNSSYQFLNSPLPQSKLKSSPLAQSSLANQSFRSQQAVKSKMSPAESRSIDQWNYVVNVLDSFDPKTTKRYLHFFQHKSNYLHLLDLDLVESTGKYEFERIELKIKFKIPRWHRSIITPFSEIYLTGGVDAEDTEIKLTNSYVYDFNNKIPATDQSDDLGKIRSRAGIHEWTHLCCWRLLRRQRVFGKMRKV